MATATDRYRGTREYMLVYCEMIRAARYGGTTTYQAIAQILNLPLTGSHMGREVGNVIGGISEDEVKHGRPMLSAVVVGVSGRPGEGFFDWARDLGRLKEDSKEAEQRFWEAEKAAVYDTWRREFKA
ncbi:MAG: hypothetical protein ACOC6F_01905 [bacterium]